MRLDILMKVTKDGDPDGDNLIDGDSQTAIDAKDELYKGFKSGKFFEILNFNFGISLMDEDVGAATTNSSGQEIVYDGKFKNFMKGQSAKTNGGQLLYPVVFDEILVERKVDRATPLMFENCFRTKPFTRISIIKRKNAGDGDTSGMIPFLRVDFDDVLITDISFSIADDTIAEDLKFVYRKLTFRYRPQNNDGSPGVVVNAGPLSLLKTNDDRSGGGSGPPPPPSGRRL